MYSHLSIIQVLYLAAELNPEMCETCNQFPLTCNVYSLEWNHLCNVTILLQTKWTLREDRRMKNIAL
jgi:hypothetical protein